MRHSIYGITFALTVASTFGSSLLAQDTMMALNRAEAAYRSLETLQASFSQTLENPMLGGTVESSGTLFLEPPSRFSMRFIDPAGDRIVSDGTWLWIYLPSSIPDQVVRQPIPNRGAATPNLLAQFVDRPLEHYRASHVETVSLEGDIVDVVSLIPRRDDDPFRQAEVSISQATGLVRRLMVVEPTGQRRTILFGQLLVNVDIASHELEFAVPEGARIVTP